MASAKNNQQLARKDCILVHAVQLKPTIKVQISGRMASIGISDVVTASAYSEKTRMIFHPPKRKVKWMAGNRVTNSSQLSSY